MKDNLKTFDFYIDNIQPSVPCEVDLETLRPNHVWIPGLEWLQPAEVQREDRAAQPETGGGDAGLRPAHDRPHRLKGKHSQIW